MIGRRDRGLLAAAGAVALAMPALLLPLARQRAPADLPKQAPPLAAPDAPPLAAAYQRGLFAPADAPDAPGSAPADAPDLVGIVGRLGQDAVALVRGADGATRTLAIGESIDGWRLASLAIDAAFFTRGAQRARVPLPVADDAADAPQ